MKTEILNRPGNRVANSAGPLGGLVVDDERAAQTLVERARSTRTARTTRTGITETTGPAKTWTTGLTGGPSRRVV